LFVFRSYSADDAFDFLNQKRQVRLSETHFGSRNPVMLDIGRDMFVMGMSALQIWIVGVRLRVVPIEFVFALPDFVTVLVNHGWRTIEEDSLPSN